MNLVSVELFGKDPKVTKAIHTAKNIAVTKAPVLIIGETGVGKKAMGRYIHQLSSRREGELVFVDCSLSAEEVENQILGHRDEGTGRFLRGALERANNGTVVLSAVDGLDTEFQKKLSKILEELVDYDIDIRLLANTTKNLSKLVGAGRFYRGLYNMISSNSIFLPPLRERTNDISEIAKAMIIRISEREGREFRLSYDALEKLSAHYWTHNIAELESVLEGAFDENTGEEINADQLLIGEQRPLVSSGEVESEGIRLMSLKEAERLLIKKALIHTSENRTQAAKILGVSIRTLRNKINEYRNIGSSYFVNLR